jgi:hypothetical protein
MTTSAVTALEVVDEDFLIASLIERCPKSMMIRELMMNALEAAQHAPEGSRFVEISAMPMDGVDKLMIWNTGPGMDDHELLKICNIASSLGKEKSLTGNFGMGAKVASLPSNKRGMRYRSCKNGRVHEVILCKRDGVYGRLRRYDSETDTYVEVVDVTDIAEQDGRPLNADWTEVVLLGNEPEQDTVRNPYNGDPEQDAQWLATYLYHRFYGLPEGVKVTLLKGTNKLDGNRQFEPIPARLRHFERYETVSLPGFMKIHYLYDAQYNGTGHNKSISGAIASAVSTCAVVYKNELYDLSKGRQWTFEAPVFGVPFGAKHISIHIELPDNFPVVPEAYRQFLQYTGGEQLRLQAKDFEALVRENRPEWLIELIHSFAPDSQTSDEIRDELQRLLNQLRVRRISPKVTAQGATNVTPGAGAAAGERAHGVAGGGGATESEPRSKPTDLSVVPAGAKRAEMFKNLERAPEIIPLNTDEEIDEKGLKGRAARYVMEAGQLFVNMKYPALDEMRAQLEAEYAGANDPELMRSLARQHAQDSMILRVGRTVVYALAKQLNKEWDQKALEAASSPESLSMAADNFADAMQNVRRAIGKALRTSRVEVDAA